MDLYHSLLNSFVAGLFYIFVGCSENGIETQVLPVNIVTNLKTTTPFVYLVPELPMICCSSALDTTHSDEQTKCFQWSQVFHSSKISTNSRKVFKFIPYDGTCISQLKSIISSTCC